MFCLVDEGMEIDSRCVTQYINEMLEYHGLLKGTSYSQKMI